MPCYNPLDMIQRDGCRTLIRFKDGMSGRRMMIPCGRCIGCRLERSRQWAVRCEHEIQMHEKSIFVTLTYRDDALVYGKERATLVPKHLQLFWKKLRKETNGGIRYFGCGEYGEQFLRPHYHAIIFGYDFKDKKYYKDSSGHPIFTSATLERIWSHGNCYIGSATFESAGYIARYICSKKLGKQSKYYAENAIEPEFCVMSKKPGIGSSWFTKYVGDVYPNDLIVTQSGSKSTAPRFYLNKLRKMQPDMYEQVNYIRLKRAEQSFEDDNNTGFRLKSRGRIKARKLQQIPRE